MQLKQILSGLALVALLATVLAGSSVAAAAGSVTIDVAQSTNETVTNDTTNGTTANATVGNLTVWTASTDRFVELSSVAAIQDGIQAGWLTRDRTVAKDDTAVFALSASDLTATVAAANAIDRERAFVQALTDSERYSFRVEQTVESILAETRPKRLNLSATRLGGALQVTPDEPNGTLYVALRTDRANFETEYRDGVPARAGDVYVVNVTEGIGSDATSSVATWEVADRTVDFDSTLGGDIIAQGGNLNCAPVAGETSVAPGTDLRFDLDPDTDEYEGWTTTATVDSSGRFFACANTSRVPQHIALSVSVDGIPDATGRVQGGPYEPTTISAEMEANGTVTVRALWFRQGFLALYEAPEEEVGVTERDRSPNCTARSVVSTVANWTRVEATGLLDHDRQRVRFDPPDDAAESGRLVAVAHPSRDGDDRLDFPGSEFPVCVIGTLEGDHVTPASEDGSRTDGNETASDPATTATSTPDGTSTTDASTAPTTTADGPGFGPVVAALALVAVSLLALRRS